MTGATWGVEETGGSIWVGELRPAPRAGFDALICSLEIDGLTAPAKARNRSRARLIAAAPDLLEALRLFVRAERMAREGNPPQDGDELVRVGEAVIAKATGEAGT